MTRNKCSNLHGPLKNVKDKVFLNFIFDNKAIFLSPNDGIVKEFYVLKLVH